jgi:hypothetical protein
MAGMSHSLSPAARALLRALSEQPDEVPSTPREPLRELTRAGLVAYVDGLPLLTTRGVNAAKEAV